MAFNPNYYQTLGVDHQASQQVIDHVYKNLQRAYHPDMHPENRDFYTEKIKVINEAHETLGNPHNRAKYDCLLAEHQRSTSYEDEAQNVAETIAYCSGCGRQVEGLVVTCPHCGTWISAGNSRENNNHYQNYRDVQSGARLMVAGIKIAKTGARLLGESVFRSIGSASR